MEQKLVWTKVETKTPIRVERSYWGPLIFDVEVLPGDKTFFLLVSIAGNNKKEWFGCSHSDSTTKAGAKTAAEHFIGFLEKEMRGEENGKRVRKRKRF